VPPAPPAAPRLTMLLTGVLLRYNAGQTKGPGARSGAGSAFASCLAWWRGSRAVQAFWQAG
jgi:hypothetical protein